MPRADAQRNIDALLAAEAPELAAAHDPGEALELWIWRYAKFIAGKRGLAAALHSGDPAFRALPAYFRQHLGPAAQTLLDAAVAAGAIRDGADPIDLLGAPCSSTARITAPARFPPGTYHPGEVVPQAAGGRRQAAGGRREDGTPACGSGSRRTFSPANGPGTRRDGTIHRVTDSRFDVVIAGGGPVGMWLAAELRRGGVRPAVLEKRASRPPQSKAMTIYPRTLEQFAMRGIADRWIAEGTPVPTSHFAILTSRLELDWLDTAFPYTLFLPQRRTEELIAAHLTELGVPVLRGHTVTGLRQDPGGVTLDVDTPEGHAEFRAAYAVGCDGASSAARAAAGIEWAGEPPSWTSIMGDVELADPPPGRAATLARPGGSIFMVDIRDGRWRVATIDHATLDDPPGKPVTFADLRDSVLRLAGTDFGMRETEGTWLSRVDNETRHAAAYRSGRVLLAGDAAHIHFPAGGQGLNLGLQDATNLAWKLAATVRGWAPPGLLDTYHAERSAVAAEVIADSRAQCALFASPTAEGRALRDRFDILLAAHGDLRRDLALRLSGLAVRYPAGGPGDYPAGGPGDAADSLLGTRVPDLALRGAPAPTVFGLLRDATFVLLSLDPDPDGFPAPDGFPVPAGYRDRLRVVTAGLAADRPAPAGWSGVRAVLIRPDGYAAWLLRDGDTPASSPPLAAWLAPEHPGA